MNHRLSLVVGLLLVISLFSCKKNNGTQQQCQLISLTDSTTTVQAVTQFTYDNSGRVTSAVVTGQKGCTRTYQYIGNTVVFAVTDTTPGILAEVDTIVLNDFGLIQTQVARYTTSGSTSLYTYSYDDAGNALNSIETKNGLVGDTEVYNTVGGDLIYETEKGSSVHLTDFSYYPSESIVYGDPTDFRQILYYGAYYYKNKHMISVLSTPGYSYKSFTYSFSNGRIAQAMSRQWTSSSADTVTHIQRYSYSCK